MQEPKTPEVEPEVKRVVAPAEPNEPVVVPATEVEGMVVPTISATEAKENPAKSAKWNPNGLDVSMLPNFLRPQFVPGYLKTTPAYLDGSMAGDIGFDPLGLVALANPTSATDKFARLAADRDAKFASMSKEEQKAALAWMRESELKHARLAMLATAGWPLAELYSGDGLKNHYTNGRAPSLFNGHLLDWMPFLVVFFGPIAFQEIANWGKNYYSDPQGEHFDPMGLAGEQKPYMAFPFEAFMGPRTPIDGIPNAKDMDAMKVAEIKNGRLAMMAITGMATQEFVWGNPVVDQTPFFFGK
jgi:hypothetical protein